MYSFSLNKLSVIVKAHINIIRRVSNALSLQTALFLQQHKRIQHNNSSSKVSKLKAFLLFLKKKRHKEMITNVTGETFQSKIFPAVYCRFLFCLSHSKI